MLNTTKLPHVRIMDCNRGEVTDWEGVYHEATTTEHRPEIIDHDRFWWFLECCGFPIGWDRTSDRFERACCPEPVMHTRDDNKPIYTEVARAKIDGEDRYFSSYAVHGRDNTRLTYEACVEAWENRDG